MSRSSFPSIRRSMTTAMFPGSSASGRLSLRGLYRDEWVRHAHDARDAPAPSSMAPLSQRQFNFFSIPIPG